MGGVTLLLAKLLYAACMVAWWVIRYPSERRNKRNTIIRNERDRREWTLLTISFIGLGVIPGAYILTGFPRSLNQGFSPYRAWVGFALFLGALLLFRATHKALGRNWSVTLAVRQEHTLVTDSVYRLVRHPMYLAFWLWALAQVCLLQNWFAGLSGVIGFGTLYAFRIGREERLMRETFGPVWDAYVARSWRLLPLLH